LTRLLNSRFAFEDALERGLTTDPDLLQELGHRRALDRIRLRRGWEVSGEVSQALAIPVEEEELLIQGPDGVSLRTVMIHRDAQSLAVRVVESSEPTGGAARWQVGDDLQVPSIATTAAVSCSKRDCRNNEIWESGSCSWRPLGR
jgi:hypothetical protein